MDDWKEGESRWLMEATRVNEEGCQQGEWDCSQGVPMRDVPASGYPEGSPLDLDYRAGYRAGYSFYQAELRAEKVRVWRNKRRDLRGLKPVITPVEYWSKECARLDSVGDHKGLQHAQDMYQEACDMERWKLRLGVSNQ